MKIGIVGDLEVAQSWEYRLQKHLSVREVVLVRKSEYLPNLNACIIVNPTNKAFDEAAIALRKGISCFLVSKIPVDRNEIERLCHFSEESGAQLQLAHWSSYSPASQWIQARIPNPDYLHVIRNITYSQFSRYDGDFSQIWVDDVAYCLKTMKSNVHRVDAGLSGIRGNKAPHIQVFMRFDNGGTACIVIQTTASTPIYKRTICNAHHTIEYDVTEQSLIFSDLDAYGNIFQEIKRFENEEPADRALTLFLKSVQTRTPPEYSIFDSLNLARVCRQLEEKYQRNF